MKRHTIYFAPDTGTSTAVAASDSPSGQAIETAPAHQAPAPEIHQLEPAEQIRQSGVKISKLDVMKELGLKESPSAALEREAKAARDARTGRFTKASPAPKKPKAKAEPAAPAAAAPAAATPEPAPTLGNPAPTPAKIKIGKEEKTAEEWEKHFEELAKAKEAPKPAETTPAAPAAPTAQDPAKDEAAQREEWISKAAERYAPTQAEFDKMLADGDTKAFGRFLAMVEENNRKWAIATFAPHIERMQSSLAPITQMSEQQAAMQTESRFLDSHPEIKAAIAKDPTKISIHRELCHEFALQVPKLEKWVAENPTDQMFADRLNALKADFLGEVAKATKAKMGLNGSAAPAAAAPASPAPALVAAPAAPKPRPAPPTGNLGGAGAPKQKNDQASQVSELLARGF